MNRKPHTNATRRPPEDRSNIGVGDLAVSRGKPERKAGRRRVDSIKILMNMAGMPSPDVQPKVLVNEHEVAIVIVSKFMMVA